MNFVAFDQTMRAVLNAISGIPTGIAQDRGQSQYFAQVGSGLVTDGHGNTLGTGTNSQAVVTYEILSVQGFGQDEWRTRYDPTVHPVGDTYAGPGAPLGSMILENTGNREVHVQIKCECFVNVDGDVPVAIVERVRTTIHLPSVLDSLNTAGFALQRCFDTVATSYDDDNGRAISVAILEIVLNGADGVEDLPDTTIEILDMPKPGAGLTVVPGL